MRHIVLGTAGHIDHGKTALVKRLTGIDCDRLDEEKRRGITIELGFAPWTIPPTDDSLPLGASIIDVPGHERLVRTMVAGAGGMDLAMLVVAADDGVMPQTREHLDVLRLLGVPAGVVVLTKCDLLAGDAELLDLVQEDVRAAVTGSVFERGPIIRTSSKTGEGLGTLAREVARLAAAVERRADMGPAFLPLDRLFTKAGYGTIGTGTTLRGKLQTGDEVEAWSDATLPVGGLKVRGLQALGSDRDRVSAGMRTAVNLTGKGVEGVQRGAVIAHTGAFAATDSAIVWAEVLGGARTMTEETLIAHLGTTERETRVIPLGVGTDVAGLGPGASGGLLLRFDRPVACYAGQRFVLRRPGVHGQATVAGGEVLDPEPPRGKGAVSLAAAQLGLLRSTVKDRLIAVARESRAAGVTLAAISRRMPPGEGERTARALAKKGKLVLIQGAPGTERWIDADLADGLVRKVVGMVSAYHDAAPMAAGLPEAEVASQLPPPERHLAAALVARAVAGKKLVRDGAVLTAPGRGASVDAAARAELEAIESLYRDADFTPPSDKEAIQTLGLSAKRFAELASLLRRQKGLIKITGGMHFHSDVVATIETRVCEALSGDTTLTASELKDALGGVSRKYAIPLLEFLDRRKITMRQGNVRRLHPSRK